jgi:hypothetical protein
MLRGGRFFEEKLDMVFSQLRREARIYGPEGSGGSGRGELQVAGPRELQETVHNSLEPQNLVFDHLRVRIFAGTDFQFLLLEEEGPLDGGQRVADFMGDARSERAQGDQLLLALQECLALH